MSLWMAPAAALAVAWLWFLARGKARGSLKRLAFRVTLLAVLAASYFFTRSEMSEPGSGASASR